MSPLQIIDVEQNTDAWFAARLGLPTASCFSKIMAKGEGKTRRKYMLTLAGEILLKQRQEGYSNANMERGHPMEEDAATLYAFLRDDEVSKTGFWSRGTFGGSPDRRVGARGLLQIKSMQPDLLLDLLSNPRLPPEHKAQVQGELLVGAGAVDWIDFMAFWPGLKPVIVRVEPDLKYHAELTVGIEEFRADLEQFLKFYEGI